MQFGIYSANEAALNVNDGGFWNVDKQAWVAQDDATWFDVKPTEMPPSTGQDAMASVCFNPDEINKIRVELHLRMQVDLAEVIGRVFEQHRGDFGRAGIRIPGMVNNVGTVLASLLFEELKLEDGVGADGDNQNELYANLGHFSASFIEKIDLLADPAKRAEIKEYTDEFLKLNTPPVPVNYPEGFADSRFSPEALAAANMIGCDLLSGKAPNRDYDVPYLAEALEKFRAAKPKWPQILSTVFPERNDLS